MEMVFDAEAASWADKGGIIDESGYYTGTITKADIQDGRGDSKSVCVIIGIETDNGQRCDYIKLFTRKKDGERNKKGFGQMMALLSLVKIVKADVVSDGDRKAMPCLIGKRIAVGLQKEWYTKTDGSDGWNMGLTHFFDPTTHRTYSEQSEGKEAKVWGTEIKDKDRSQSGQVLKNPPQDDCPF